MTNTSYVYMRACNNFQFHVHVMESFLLAGCCNVSVYEWFLLRGACEDQSLLQMGLSTVKNVLYSQKM